MSIGKIKVEVPQSERSDAEAARAAPVSLPAGSFDAAALGKDLAEAAKAKNDKNREDLVAGAVATHNKIGTATTGLQPGYERVEVENVELGITESRIVYNPDKAEEAEAAQAGAPAIDAKGE